MKYFKYLSSILLIASVSIYAQFYDLQCVPGHVPCKGSHCTTIVFNNKTEKTANITGELRAKLTGAARLVNDGKFTFYKIFKKSSINSCHIDTRSFRRSVNHIDVTVNYNKHTCKHFVPKSNVAGQNLYYADLNDDNCVIRQ
jgi:hypothetical protein